MRFYNTMFCSSCNQVAVVEDEEINVKVIGPVQIVTIQTSLGEMNVTDAKNQKEIVLQVVQEVEQEAVDLIEEEIVVQVVVVLIVVVLAEITEIKTMTEDVS